MLTATKTLKRAELFRTNRHRTYVFSFVSAMVTIVEWDVSNGRLRGGVRRRMQCVFYDHLVMCVFIFLSQCFFLYIISSTLPANILICLFILFVQLIIIFTPMFFSIYFLQSVFLCRTTFPGTNLNRVNFFMWSDTRSINIKIIVW